MAKKKKVGLPTEKATRPKAASKKKPVMKRASTKKPSSTKKAKSVTSVPDRPLTLDEAKSLVANQPKVKISLARAESESTQGNQASHARVGQEIEKLVKKQNDEVSQRIDDYYATMKILKSHGVCKASQGKTRTAKRVRAETTTTESLVKPLRIVAEGDSWFDYPVPFFGGGIIPRLEALLGVPILNLAKAGDEVRYMLGVESRKTIIEHLTHGDGDNDPWDVMLFSGGGNDIVGDPMALWINDYAPGASASQSIHQARFASALQIVKAGYEDLIALRNRLSPSTHLVFHAYDFALPTGKGVCHLGPWLKPTFDLRNYPAGRAAEVVKAMLMDFATMLKALTSSHDKVTFINGQGTLPATPNSWHNELHPSSQGYQTFAKLFHTTLKSLFADRVF